MIDKGIIEPAGHGELRFTMPGFDRYIREITDSGSGVLDAANQSPPERPGTRPRPELGDSTS